MASVSEVVEQLPCKESGDLGGLCEAQQGSFGSSGQLSRCCCFRWEVVGRWPWFAEVVKSRPIKGKRSLVVRVWSEGSSMWKAADTLCVTATSVHV
jgi:hypothetical protein